jgi:transposase
MLTLTYEYRIYPDAQQERQMLDWLEQCRLVWNYNLAERRDWIRSRSCRVDACSLKQEYIIPADAPRLTYHYQQAQLTEARAKYPELAAVHSQVLQCVVAHHLCSGAGMIFAEELNLKALVKGMLSKHCLDAGWGQFLTILGYIAWKRGVYFAKVPAGGTSQECPQCNASVPKNLSVRVHNCPECAYQTNRDVASSQVIRNRGLVVVGHITQACGAEPVGVALKQEIRQVIVGSPRRTR